MDFIKKNYEKVLMGVVLLGLVVGAASLPVMISGERASLQAAAEAEIKRERLALEEAVRRVEREAARRARDARVPTFSDLATDADDLGMAHPSSLNEINVELPSMTIACAASGRLTPMWRCTWR